MAVAVKMTGTSLYYVTQAYMNLYGIGPITPAPLVGTQVVVILGSGTQDDSQMLCWICNQRGLPSGFVLAQVPMTYAPVFTLMGALRAEVLNDCCALIHILLT